MNLKSKIWLVLVLVMAPILAIDLWLSNEKMEQELQQEVRIDAEAIHGYMMATRRIYQQQFIDSGLPLNHKTVGFLPAHSFSRIAKDFANWNQSGIIFNNVSDRPRNPGNQADRFELEDMAWFREHPEQTNRLRQIRDEQEIGFTLFSAPIRIEPFCLKCHGSAEEAPPGIRELYPDTAYGYQLGDLRGLISIKIPTQRLDDRRARIWTALLLKGLGGYLVLFLLLGFLLERLVIRRIAGLKWHAGRIAAGDYGARINRDGTDEICQLAKSFDHMAHEVQIRDQELGKLTAAVEQSPASIFITDLDARIEYVNERFVANTGYSRQEAIGKTPALLQSGLTPAADYRVLWQTLARGKTWQGEFTNRRKDGSLYTDFSLISPIRDEHDHITHYLAVQQDISEKKAQDARIHQLAFFDKLTGLPNRSLLMERLAHLLASTQRSQHLSALLLLNVDRFKNINEARGISFGDDLLKAMGVRFLGFIREGDTLARLAGDEYALLLPDLGQENETASRGALIVADKVHETLCKPCQVNNETVTLTTSIGITLFTAKGKEAPEDILRQADTALHRAKQQGGNQTQFFEILMGEQAERRFQVERELRAAITAGDLRLYLQPQVDATGRPIAAEVLVRWQHAERGLVLPGIFIPLAEESDLIVELGGWVLTEACKLLARENETSHPLRLSVNLSPRHFARSSFVPWIKDLLEATGADPSHLTLEVTEGLMIDNINDVVAKMSELTALGIHFSVDDFGTGYSALSYLKRLPIHEVKIDKSFVQDAPTNLDDAVLVETIIAVAQHLRLAIVAEGVETLEQAAFLNARGQIIHQGYLYGRPEPAEDWLERWRRQSRGR